MDGEDSSINERNLNRLFGRLRVETDPDRRRNLRYLAIAEEERYGRLQAQLDKVDDWIREGEARITRQRRLVDLFDDDSAHREAAWRLLINLQELQGLLLRFRKTLRESDERNGP